VEVDIDDLLDMDDDHQRTQFLQVIKNYFIHSVKNEYPILFTKNEQYLFFRNSCHQPNLRKISKYVKLN